jgi:gluconate 2-dehydrogenase gamma chain
MNRREFLECGALLITGASASQMGFALSEEQLVYLATAPSYIEQQLTYLDPAQRATIAAMAETIIPRTETPGAIDAGVPRFIELMVQQWMNDEERAIFDAGLLFLMEAVAVDTGLSFDKLDEKTRTGMLEAMEAEASDSSWYAIGNVTRQFVSDAPFICQVKELTIWGFFTSEVGGTQVLRYDPMPMQFESDIPLGPDESSWMGRPLG